MFSLFPEQLCPISDLAFVFAESKVEEYKNKGTPRGECDKQRADSDDDDDALTCVSADDSSGLNWSQLRDQMSEFNKGWAAAMDDDDD